MKIILLLLSILLLFVACESKIEDCNSSTIQKTISKMIAKKFSTFSKIKLSDIELII